MGLRIFRSLPIALFLAFAGATAAHAAPGKLVGVSATPNPVATNAPVTVTVSKTGQNCSFRINYGDGPGNGPHGFPFSETHTYSQPGSYTISVWGVNGGGPPACNGGTETTQVTVTGNGNRPGNGGTVSIMEAPHSSDLGAKKPEGIKLAKLTTHGIVTPAKDHAKFTISANRSANLNLRVFALIPPPHRRCDESYSPLRAMPSFGKKLHWNAQIVGLSPSKTHYWEVCANDGMGDTAMDSGTFKTGNRKVEVHFDMVKITDDSDSSTLR